MSKEIRRRERVTENTMLRKSEGQKQITNDKYKVHILEGNIIFVAKVNEAVGSNGEKFYTLKGFKIDENGELIKPAIDFSTRDCVHPNELVVLSGIEGFKRIYDRRYDTTYFELIVEFTELKDFRGLNGIEEELKEEVASYYSVRDMI